MGMTIRPEGMDHAIEAAGVAAIAALSDEEFGRRLQAMKAGYSRLRQVQKELMQDGVHYGMVPGTEKPTLFKPGAEFLCSLYRLVADVQMTLVEGDGDESPRLRYDAVCYLRVGTLEGAVVAVGHGTANSWEPKYRWRKKRAELTCPACGSAGTLIKGRAESKLKGRWWDGPRDGGCGETFDADDEAITRQPRGSTVTENPDPLGLANTLLKMAEKRAYVDATLRGTATSSLFTQDVDDRDEVAIEAAEDVEQQTEWAGTVVLRNGDMRLGGGDAGEYGEGQLPELRFGLRGSTWNARVVTTGTLAEELADTSLAPGDRVHVTGTLRLKPWDKDGTPMPPYREITAETVSRDE